MTISKKRGSKQTKKELTIKQRRIIELADISWALT
ncbi:hypothetical protein LCGC14_1182570, partial [marine sediment metagenome]